jgi:hypothetical protein
MIIPGERSYLKIRLFLTKESEHAIEMKANLPKYILSLFNVPDQQ